MGQFQDWLSDVLITVGNGIFQHNASVGKCQLAEIEVWENAQIWQNT